MMRTLLCWLACVASLHAASIHPGTQVEPYRLIRVTPDQGERVWILPWCQQATTGIDVVTADNGDVVWTGPPGIYAVLWISETGQGQTFVTIGNAPDPVPVPPGPGPGPNPPPNPPGPAPDGFAGDVFREAVKVNRPVDAQRLADEIRAVRSIIAAGGVTREESVVLLQKHLNELNLDSAWRPFALWFGQQSNQRAQTLPKILEFLQQAITGLEAAAG